MKTFDAEAGLPRVPLHSLEESCRLFLEWCAPLLNSMEMQETEAATLEMLAPDSVARQLHSALEDYDRQSDVNSWLDDFWRTRYLGRRDRIALNANFALAFKKVDLTSPLRRAAELSRAAVDLLEQVVNERLQVASLRGRDLSMEQFRSLFSTTRIPAMGRDRVRRPWTDEYPGPPQERHILVMCRNHIFTLDVISRDGRPYSVAELESALAVIQERSAEPHPYPLGQLTTGAREIWARDRDKLVDAHPDNAHRLDLVESALFCLCLDDSAADHLQSQIDTLLHGNCGNRWFDKAISLIVLGNGQAGINIEHCGLDGTTVLTLIDHLHTFREEPQDAAAARVPHLSEIEFNLNAGLEERIGEAGDQFRSFARETASCVIELEDFGAKDIKRLGSSPDAFVQMAYQWTHFKVRGFCGATYESIATRHFSFGRTEAMRVVTHESIRFAKTMSDEAASETEKVAALKSALAAHSERARQCQAGDAPEQHLWELQMLQKRRAEDPRLRGRLPLYESPGWRIMRDDYLSTSSVPSETVRGMGFGSTSSHCIGIGYVLLADSFSAYLSSPRAFEAELNDFTKALQESIDEMRVLLGRD